jgi:hypothetical protein|tara:strand:+ start:641 stop:862 length:222 start_codon:yes stop_codon:yes gene_type:complete
MSQALNKDHWDLNGINMAAVKCLAKVWKVSSEEAYDRLMEWIVHNPNPNNTAKDQKKKTEAEKSYGRPSDLPF